jgi:hypothetical protein
MTTHARPHVARITGRELDTHAPRPLTGHAFGTSPCPAGRRRCRRSPWGRTSRDQDQFGKQDPQTQFESREEQQSGQIPHPGTTGQMEDEPDHGEDSYRGTNRTARP